MKNFISIRTATIIDIPHMVQLSHEKRLAYEKIQPFFWQHAEQAESIQTEWFTTLLHDDKAILLVAESSQIIIGFIIGHLSKAPGVYHQDGLTLTIDDFCVQESTQWESVGAQFLSEIKIMAHQKNAVQMVIVCGAHDQAKRNFLKKWKLSLVSEWYTTPL